MTAQQHTTTRYKNGVIASLANEQSGDHLGLGVFESFRLRRSESGWTCPAFADHLLSLTQAASALNLHLCSPPEVIETLLDYLNTRVPGSVHDLWIRVKCRPSDWVLECRPFRSCGLSSKESICAITLEAERPFPQWRHFSAMVSVMARRVAAARDAEEALLIDRRGLLKEGAWSNVFVADDQGTLFTPTENILQGVTRDLLLSKGAYRTTVETELEIDWVRRYASEIFITHAAYGVAAVTVLDGEPVGNGEVGPITGSLKSWYEEYARSEAAEWPYPNGGYRRIAAVGGE